MRWKLLMLAGPVFLLSVPTPGSADSADKEQVRRLETRVEQLTMQNKRLNAARAECLAERDSCRERTTAKFPDTRPDDPPTGGPSPPKLSVGGVAMIEHPGAKQSVAKAAEPQQSAGGRRATPPPQPRSGTYFQSAGGPQDGKADQAVSPIPFPRVPGRTDWFEAHLASQLGVLNRLYTDAALRSLEQDERSCNDPRTRIYCKIRVRLYWIESAL